MHVRSAEGGQARKLYIALGALKLDPRTKLFKVLIRDIDNYPRVTMVLCLLNNQIMLIYTDLVRHAPFCMAV